MKYALLGIFSFVFAISASASWYWPFGGDSDDTNAPPRLHRLLEKANDYIELAEDESLNGEGDKAIELYRQALDELDRIERENPDRAEKPEFAPLRNKRATCSAAIDAIRFAQVEENERAVAVTDTRELQKKWRRKKGLELPSDKVDDDKKKAAPTEPAEPSKLSKPAKPAESAKPTKPSQMSFEEKLADALKEIKGGDCVAADLILDELLRERPTDLTALLLRAAAQSGLGSDFAARRTLEKAMRAHPKSPLPYYNLARLALKLDGGVEAAREYYDIGRACGGAPDKALEAKLLQKGGAAK